MFSLSYVLVIYRGLEANDPSMNAQLSRPRIHPLSDGKVHLAKIAYFPEVKFDYLANFTATEHLLPYIVVCVSILSKYVIYEWDEYIRACSVCMRNLS